MGIGNMGTNRSNFLQIIGDIKCTICNYVEDVREVTNWLPAVERLWDNIRIKDAEEPPKARSTQIPHSQHDNWLF